MNANTNAVYLKSVQPQQSNVKIIINEQQNKKRKRDLIYVLKDDVSMGAAIRRINVGRKVIVQKRQNKNLHIC